MSTPSPTVWVCGACGRVGETRRTVGDESCLLNAVECWRSSIRYREGTTLAEYAVTADTDWVEPLPPPEPKQEPTAAQVERRRRHLERRAQRRAAAAARSERRNEHGTEEG